MVCHVQHCCKYEYEKIYRPDSEDSLKYEDINNDENFPKEFHDNVYNASDANCCQEQAESARQINAIREYK